MINKISIRILPALLFPALLFGSVDDSYSRQARKRFSNVKQAWCNLRCKARAAHHKPEDSRFEFPDVANMRRIRDEALSQGSIVGTIQRPGFQTLRPGEVEEISRRQSAGGKVWLYKVRFNDMNVWLNSLQLPNRMMPDFDGIYALQVGSDRKRRLVVNPRGVSIPKYGNITPSPNIGEWIYVVPKSDEIPEVVDLTTYSAADYVSIVDLYAPDVAPDVPSDTSSEVPQRLTQRRGGGCCFCFQDDVNLMAETHRVVAEHAPALERKRMLDAQLAAQQEALAARREEWEGGWQRLDPQSFLGIEEDD